VEPHALLFILILCESFIIEIIKKLTPNLRKFIEWYMIHHGFCIFTTRWLSHQWAT